MTDLPRALKKHALWSVSSRLEAPQMARGPQHAQGKPHNPDRLVDYLSPATPLGPRKRKLKFMGLPDNPPYRRRRGPDPDEPEARSLKSLKSVARPKIKSALGPARRKEARRALVVNDSPPVQLFEAPDPGLVLLECAELDANLDANLDVALDASFVAELRELLADPEVPVDATARHLDANFGAALGPREIDPLQILYSPAAALPRELDLLDESAEDRSMFELGNASIEEAVLAGLPKLCLLNYSCEARLVALAALERLPQRYAERTAHVQALSALSSVHAPSGDLRRFFRAAAVRSRLAPQRARTISQSLLAKSDSESGLRAPAPVQRPREFFVDVWREARSQQSATCAFFPNFRVRVV